MNQKEKLIEATIKALQGKLIEDNKENKYTLTYYLNSAAAERRPTTEDDIEDDWIEESFNANNDGEASKIALETVYDLDEDEVEEDYEPDEEGIYNLECDDWGSGEPIILKLVNETTKSIVYDSGYDKEEFIDFIMS